MGDYAYAENVHRVMYNKTLLSFNKHSHINVHTHTHTHTHTHIYTQIKNNIYLCKKNEKLK